MTARVLMMLKFRTSLTRIRACFPPGRATDLPAPRKTTSYQTIWSVTSPLTYAHF